MDLTNVPRPPLKRVHRLTTIAREGSSSDRATDRRTSFVVIELANLWAQFARAYYLACALGGSDSQGSPVVTRSSRLNSVNDAITIAVWANNQKLILTKKTWRPRDEPDWNQPAVLHKSLSAIAARNKANVESATSVGSKVFEHLPKARNFYAHRGPGTAPIAVRIATRYPIPSNLPHPTQVLNFKTTKLPEGTVLLTWLSDITLSLRKFAGI